MDDDIVHLPSPSVYTSRRSGFTPKVFDASFSNEDIFWFCDSSCDSQMNVFGVEDVMFGFDEHRSTFFTIFSHFPTNK